MFSRDDMYICVSLFRWHPSEYLDDMKTYSGGMVVTFQQGDVQIHENRDRQWSYLP